MSQGMPWLRTSYTMGNSYFTGATKAERLADRFAVAALDYLQKDADDNQELNEIYEPAVSAKEFANRICKALKVVDLWQRSTIKKFGKVAEESTSFGVLITHLTTRAGIKKVLACMDSNTHLHGTSSTNIGIRECYEFYEQFAKCLAGSKPPPAVDPAAAPKTPPEAPTAGSPKLDEDAMAMAELVGKQEDKLDAQDAEIIDAARCKMNTMEVVQTKDEALKRAGIHENRPAIILVDFPTSSKVSVCSGIDIAMEIAAKLKNDDTRVLVTLHNRFEIFGDAHSRLRPRPLGTPIGPL